MVKVTVHPELRYVGFWGYSGSSNVQYFLRRGGGGALPSNGLKGMCRGMESRIFTTGLTIIALHSNGSHIFGILGVRKY